MTLFRLEANNNKPPVLDANTATSCLIVWRQEVSYKLFIFNMIAEVKRWPWQSTEAERSEDKTGTLNYRVITVSFIYFYFFCAQTQEDAICAARICQLPFRRFEPLGVLFTVHLCRVFSPLPSGKPEQMLRLIAPAWEMTRPWDCSLENYNPKKFFLQGLTCSSNKRAGEARG